MGNTKPVSVTVVAGLAALLVGWGLCAADYDLPASKDARILMLPGYEDANYKADILSVYTYGDNIQRTFMQFDLAAVTLAPGQRLASATLRLSASTGFGPSNGKPMEIHAVSRSWTEDGLTWFHADAATRWARPGGDFTGLGGDLNGSPFAVSTANPPADAPVTWDVRELVDQWLEGVRPNHGLVLKSVEGNGLTFVQRESPSAALRPVLHLVVDAGPPRLRIEREADTGKVVLSWRGVGTAVLQERSALAPGPDWADSPLPVLAVNGRSVVTLANLGAARLYRLRSN